MALQLKVREARPADVGRGIARVDPADLARLGADIGDLLEVRGQRATLLKAMPLYPDGRGQSLVQMDGVARANARASLGDTVEVAKAQAGVLQRLALSAPAGARVPGALGERLLQRFLEGLPVTSGDALRVEALGQGTTFQVERCAPERGVVGSATRIELHRDGAGSTAARVAYEDIGGLKGQLRRIREMIELPLRHPELFDQVGIDPPKGVLLHGPPGTGKTLIARAVASEADARFYSISGPEIMHKLYGESEGRLREMFAEAQRNAPSILFLDEIDAIAPKREEASGDVERRVVAQLLACMDGLASRGHVVVIGATNIPNALDPALRRPGRFDREIEISVPSRPDRLEILQVHSRAMPLAEDVDLAALAEVTHGYVGSDLAALCREAAMACLREAFPEPNAKRSLPPEQLLALKVRMEHFRQGLREVGPSMIREVAIEVPRVRWDDVGGLDDVKRELQEMVEWPVRHPEVFQYAGSTPPRGILLWGSPGTGKTLLARALATESQLNFISIKGPELLSKWVGESERGVREVFRKARLSAPCLLFLDEVDSMAPARGSYAADRVQERVVR